MVRVRIFCVSSGWLWFFLLWRVLCHWLLASWWFNFGFFGGLGRLGVMCMNWVWIGWVLLVWGWICWLNCRKGGFCGYATEVLRFGLLDMWEWGWKWVSSVRVSVGLSWMDAWTVWTFVLKACMPEWIVWKFWHGEQNFGT